jgi:hypothetical protein
MIGMTSDPGRVEDEEDLGPCSATRRAISAASVARGTSAREPSG